MSKMTGKQEVVGDFDLSAFVGEAEDTREASHPKNHKNNRSNAARKREPDPFSEVVQMKLTKSEMDTLKRQAGLVPISSWLRQQLQQRGCSSFVLML